MVEQEVGATVDQTRAFQAGFEGRLEELNLDVVQCEVFHGGPNESLIVMLRYFVRDPETGRGQASLSIPHAVLRGLDGAAAAHMADHLALRLFGAAEFL